KSTEPAIGQVHLHIPAQRSLRADGEHIANDQHADHKLGIDRGPTVVGIMGCKLGIDPRQVENRSDLANQVIVGNGLVKAKRVKQPALVRIWPPHHRPAPPRIVTEGRNYCSRKPTTTFATKSARLRRRPMSVIRPLLGGTRTFLSPRVIK